MRAGSGSSRSWRFRLPQRVRLGRVRRRREARRPGGARLLLLRRAGARFDLGYAATAFGWGGGRLADALAGGTGRGRVQPVRTSKVETLLIGGALDLSTPPQVATKELLPYLPNGHQVVLPGFGHSPTSGRPAGSRHPADQHLLRQRPGRRLALQAAERRLHARGRQHGAGQGHRGRHGRPRAAHGALAAVDGSPRAPRGRFGRKASAALRSLYPIVLGLGGWFLGALIVLTTMPGAARRRAARRFGRRADRPRRLLGLGEPRLVRASAAGFAAAWEARSSARGWGSTPPTDLLALVTAIVGGAGANL